MTGHADRDAAAAALHAAYRLMAAAAGGDPTLALLAAEAGDVYWRYMAAIATADAPKRD